MVSVAERFGANLKRCRKQAGLSQEEIAWRAALHRTQIGALERGGHMPGIDTVAKLAGALGASPCDLLDGIVWKPARTESGRFLDG
ncbi:MAG TPA: helix-turn-helix transcriptional regulator [Solirubrobacterales bacterium]|nr:helix-turn-helix transcriptional regulator [Solirubrobacterales bacterium]